MSAGIYFNDPGQALLVVIHQVAFIQSILIFKRTKYVLLENLSPKEYQRRKSVRVSILFFQYEKMAVRDDGSGLQRRLGRDKNRAA